jgi:hypothetical protein
VLYKIGMMNMRVDSRFLIKGKCGSLVPVTKKQFTDIQKKLLTKR